MEEEQPQTGIIDKYRKRRTYDMRCLCLCCRSTVDDSQLHTTIHTVLYVVYYYISTKTSAIKIVERKINSNNDNDRKVMCTE